MRGNFLTPIAILLTGAMLSGAMVWSVHEVASVVGQANQAQLAAYQTQYAAYQAQLAQAQAAAAPAQPAPPPNVDSAKVAIAGSPFIGSPAAPVTMAYWFDYQCPFCQHMEQTVMPGLIKDYVQSGQLKIVFKDYTFLGPDSETAALAARAVWEVAPDKFYEWHQAMFAHQDQENAGWGSASDILALTRTIPGIDADKVQQLIMTKTMEYDQALQADGFEGSMMGISGTPGAIIGKSLIVGAQAYGQFKAAVDAALKNVATASTSPPAIPPT